MLGGQLVQLLDHTAELGFRALGDGLIAGDGVVLLFPNHGAQTGVEGVERAGVDDTCVDVDALGDDVHHHSRLGILGDLGTEGGLVVSGLDDLPACGAHSLQYGRDHIQFVTGDGGGTGVDGANKSSPNINNNSKG